MSLKSFFLKPVCAFCFGLITLLVYTAGVEFSQAQVEPILIFEINGGEATSIVNGVAVDLGWYIDGPIANCSINHGDTVIHVVDLSSLPATGTLSVIPPDDTSTTYSMNCDSLVSSVIAYSPPEVTMTLTYGSPVVLSPVTGGVDVRVEWDSRYANRCSYISYEEASAPGVITAITFDPSVDYEVPLAINGYIRFDAWPYFQIREDTTFYITCYNDLTGVETTGSTTVEVLDAPPPEDPVTDVFVKESIPVAMEELLGYARVDIGYISANVTRCTRNAYYEDGVEYYVSGWSTTNSVPYITYNYYNIRIATTTIFETVCSRPEFTVNGITYPYATTSDQVLVPITLPAGVTDLASWDRTVLPPVEVTITAVPDPVTKDPVSGSGEIFVDVTTNYAEFCYFRARTTDGVDFSLGGWSTGRVVAYNTFTTKTPLLSTTTKLYVNCYRSYDVDLGDPAEQANGSTTASTTVEAIDDINPASPPVTYLYANPVVVTAEEIWNTHTVSSGDFRLYDGGSATGLIIYGYPPSSVGHSITFPFPGPDGVYNLHFGHYDEEDGESDFTVSIPGLGLSENVISNRPYSIRTAAYDSHNLYLPNLREGVVMTTGDLITVDCDSPDAGEACRFKKLVFGQGNDGSVTAEVNPVSGWADTELHWMSEETTGCNGELAVESDGTTYDWTTSARIQGVETLLLSASTTFGMTCGRSGDALKDTSTTEVQFPNAVNLTIETLVSSGECIDGNTLTTIDAPVGYIADPISGICVPSVDFSVSSPAFSLTTAIPDGVNGTYDNVDSLLVIKNLGQGELPVGSSTSYRNNISFDSNHPAPFLPFQSPVEYYTGGLVGTPDPATPVNSPTLAIDLDNVPFGYHSVCSQVNLDGSPNFPENVASTTNNTVCGTVTVPVPRPPMSIIADRELIASGGTTTITWSAHTSYPLNCEVRGAGGITEDFDASASHPSPYVNSMLTTALTSTSKFVLTCSVIAGSINAVFTEEVEVEVVPKFEET